MAVATQEVEPRSPGRPRSCECGECFKCKRADYMRDWWQRKTPEEKRAHIAKRDPESVRENYRKRQARRRSLARPEFLKKQRARRLTRDALSRGDLKRPEVCDDCGGVGQPYSDGRVRIHAHHEDHDKPLDVTWLCRDCHHDLHGFGAEVAA